MTKFKKGDKVVIKDATLSGYDVPQFTMGVVLEDDNMPWVLWEIGIGDRRWATSEKRLAKVHTFKVGDKVRVRKWVENPKHGWSGVTHKSIGTLRSSTDGKVTVDFPELSTWTGLAWELTKAKEEKVETTTPDYASWIGKPVRVGDYTPQDLTLSSKNKYRILIDYHPGSDFPFKTNLYENGEDTRSPARWKYAQLDDALANELENAKEEDYLKQELTNGLVFTHKGKKYGVLDYSVLRGKGKFDGKWALFTETEPDGRSFVKPRNVFIDCPHVSTVKALLNLYDL